MNSTTKVSLTKYRKLRHYQSTLKHRQKLNAKYNPERRIRVRYTERWSPSMTSFFEQWTNGLVGITTEEPV